jgi:surface antigen
VSLRSRLRAPLIAVASTALLSGLLVCAPAPTQAAPQPKHSPSKAAMLAKERRLAKADGLTQSRAVFARSSYLCMGYQACKQAGMGNAGYAAANDKMYWRMYAGHNCTNYAAYRMVKAGMPNERPWSGGGNAMYWGTSVPSLTDRVPSVGAVAWWKANTGPAGSAGHVAYVEKVVDDDEIIVSQDSWGGDFSWAVVTKASGNWPSGFIHFNDRDIVNTTAPTVSGFAKVGAKLSATPGGWSPSDAKVSYQWYADGAPIANATRQTLALRAALLGDRIQVRTTATKSGYATKAVSSTATAAVLPASIVSTQTPALTGWVKVGQTLSVSAGSWNLAPGKVTVQWLAGGRAIPGAVSTTLPLTPDLAGLPVTAKVTARRSGYDPVTVAVPARVPVALGTIWSGRKPVLSGTAKPGQLLDIDPGTYNPADADVTVQWLRDGQPVLNATGPTYRLSALDLGAALSTRVTVTRAGYASTSLVTGETARVKVTPHIRVERIRLRHGMRLRITVAAGYGADVEGTVKVRVQGGFEQVLELRNGSAGVRLTGVAKGKHAFGVSFGGSRTVEWAARQGHLWIP